MPFPSRRRRNLCGQLDAQGIHHGEGCLQRRISLFTEGTIELFAGQSCLAGNLRHPLRARDHAQRMGYVSSIAGLKWISLVCVLLSPPHSRRMIVLPRF